MSRKNANGSAQTDLIGMRPAAYPGNEAVNWEFPEGPSQSFKQGELVCLSGDWAGAIGIYRIGANASGYGMLGVASDDASGSTSSFRGVWILSPDVIWEANVNNATTSANAQTAATDLGKKYGLTSLSGMTYVDKAKTSGKDVACTVIGFNAQDDVPCFYGRVYVKVFSERCQTYDFTTGNLSGHGVGASHVP